MNEFDDMKYMDSVIQTEILTDNLLNEIDYALKLAKDDLKDVSSSDNDNLFEDIKIKVIKYVSDKNDVKPVDLVLTTSVDNVKDSNIIETKESKNHPKFTSAPERFSTIRSRESEATVRQVNEHVTDSGISVTNINNILHENIKNDCTDGDSVYLDQREFYNLDMMNENELKNQYDVADANISLNQKTVKFLKDCFQENCKKKSHLISTPNDFEITIYNDPKYVETEQSSLETPINEQKRNISKRFVTNLQNNNLEITLTVEKVLNENLEIKEIIPLHEKFQKLPQNPTDELDIKFSSFEGRKFEQITLNETIVKSSDGRRNSNIMWRNFRIILKNENKPSFDCGNNNNNNNNYYYLAENASVSSSSKIFSSKDKSTNKAAFGDLLKGSTDESNVSSSLADEAQNSSLDKSSTSCVSTEISSSSTFDSEHTISSLNKNETSSESEISDSINLKDYEESLFEIISDEFSNDKEYKTCFKIDQKFAVKKMSLCDTNDNKIENLFCGEENEISVQMKDEEISNDLKVMVKHDTKIFLNDNFENLCQNRKCLEKTMIDNPEQETNSVLNKKGNEISIFNENKVEDQIEDGNSLNKRRDESSHLEQAIEGIEDENANDLETIFINIEEKDKFYANTKKSNNPLLTVENKRNIEDEELLKEFENQKIEIKFRNASNETSTNTGVKSIENTRLSDDFLRTANVPNKILNTLHPVTIREYADREESEREELSINNKTTNQEFILHPVTIDEPADREGNERDELSISDNKINQESDENLKIEKETKLENFIETTDTRHNSENNELFLSAVKEKDRKDNVPDNQMAITQDIVIKNEEQKETKLEKLVINNINEENSMTRKTEETNQTTVEDKSVLLNTKFEITTSTSSNLNVVSDMKQILNLISSKIPSDVDFSNDNVAFINTSSIFNNNACTCTMELPDVLNTDSNLIDCSKTNTDIEYKELCDNVKEGVILNVIPEIKMDDPVIVIDNSLENNPVPIEGAKRDINLDKTLTATNIDINCTDCDPSKNVLNENKNITNTNPIKRRASFDEDAPKNKKQKLDAHCPVAGSSKDDTYLHDLTEHNFTRLIFDVQQTIDENDSNWRNIKDLVTSEEFFKHVCMQWRSDILPNPHKNLTKRFIPDYRGNSEKLKGDLKSHTLLHCHFNNRIRYYDRQIFDLRKKLKRSFFGKMKKRKMEQKINDYVLLINDLDKSKNEMVQINKFYIDEQTGWNANYLNDKQLNYLQEQDQIIDMISEFYNK